MKNYEKSLERYIVNLAGCWEWQGAKNNMGYGQIRNKVYKGLTHRMMFEKTYGKIPVGLSLDHLCRNPICMNPSHLEAVTHQENIRRGVGSKTHCIQGHEYTEASTLYRQRTGRGIERSCRTCRDIRNKARNICLISGNIKVVKLVDITPTKRK